MDHLPHELTVRFAEGHQYALVTSDFWIPESFIIGTDKDHAAGNNNVAITLGTELGHPFYVLLGFNIPRSWQPLHVRDHVSVGSAAPHGPVAGAGIGRGSRGREKVKANAENECDK